MGNRVVAGDGTVNMMYPNLSVIVLQSLCYIFCQLKRDNTYIDMIWSLSFVLPNAIIIASK